VGLFVFWIVCAGGVAVLASHRGRSAAGFFWLSILLSPLIGLILVLLMGPPARQVVEARAISTGDMRKCPLCAELVKAEAVLCRYCGRDLPKVESVADRATTEAAVPQQTDELTASRLRAYDMGAGRIHESRPGPPTAPSGDRQGGNAREGLSEPNSPGQSAALTAAV
jgi:hypothetical protein